jgi:predicted AAA+ superfamily ATPase
MKRLFTRYLSEWKNRVYRKPLIVRGARQVGKTYSIEEFGRENFNNYIKINFEEEPDTKDFFQNFDIQNIINNG